MAPRPAQTERVYGQFREGLLRDDPAGGLCPTVPSVRSMRNLYDVARMFEDPAPA